VSVCPDQHEDWATRPDTSRSKLCKRYEVAKLYVTTHCATKIQPNHVTGRKKPLAIHGPRNGKYISGPKYLRPTEIKRSVVDCDVLKYLIDVGAEICSRM
jgi:hypothetical protein